MTAVMLHILPFSERIGNPHCCWPGSPTRGKDESPLPRLVTYSAAILLDNAIPYVSTAVPPMLAFCLATIGKALRRGGTGIGGLVLHNPINPHSTPCVLPNTLTRKFLQISRVKLDEK